VPRKKPTVSLPRYVHAVKARGKIYYYYRPRRGRGGTFSQRLPDDPRSPAFWEAYNKLARSKAGGPLPGTFGALIADYQASPEFKGLAEATKRDYARYHAIIQSLWGDLRVDALKPADVLSLRDQFKRTPHKANYLVRALSTLLSWSVPRGYRSDNPCREVRLIKTTGGYEPWPWEAITRFQAEARPRIWHVVALLLYTGQRVSDVLNLKWSDVEDDIIVVRQSKTGQRLHIPIHRELKQILETIPRDSVYVLSNESGKPWASGFQTSFRKELAKLKHLPEFQDRRLVIHGLRVSAAVMLAEAGCTSHQIAAITGQSLHMVEHYTRAVQQKALSRAAILKWEQSSESH